MKKASLSLLTLVLVLLATILHAEPQADKSVPPATFDAVVTFHEIFEPVWHQAYPAKDIPAITESVPKLQQAAKNLLEAVNANGPAHLKPSVEGVSESVEHLAAVVEKGDQAEILSALEQAHNKMHVIIEQTDAHDH